MLPDILAQHLDELSFLIPQRALLTRAPHITLASLSDLDDRIDAHLDALRIAGPPAIAALHPDDPGLFFGLFMLLVESPNQNPTALAPLLDAAVNFIIPAIAWLSPNHAPPILTHLTHTDSPPAHRALGFAGYSARRHDPGLPLTNAVLDADPRVRARAFRAAGELGRLDLARDIHAGLADSSLACRFWAANAGALFHDPDALPILWEIAAQDVPFAERALDLAARCTPSAETLENLRDLANNPEKTRATLKAAAATGDPIVIPWLLEYTKTPILARLAGESITTITGIRLENDLATKPPPNFKPGPTDDPRDPDVSLDPDSDLPWPAPEALASVCTQQAPTLPPGIRLLLGKPMDPAWLRHILASGFQRERAAAAIEIALAHPGQPLFEVRAPAQYQITLLRG